MSVALKIAEDGEAQVVDALRELVSKVSLNQLQDFSKRTELTIQPLENGGNKTEGYWLSFILVSSTPLKLTFRAQFKSDDAKILASRAYAKDPKELSNEQASDFIKEFCNLTAGILKKRFQSQKLTTKITLPVVLRGQSSAPTPLHTTRIYKGDWEIAAKEAKIQCSTTIEVLDEAAVKALRKEEFAWEEDQETIEFL